MSALKRRVTAANQVEYCTRITRPGSPEKEGRALIIVESIIGMTLLTCAKNRVII